MNPLPTTQTRLRRWGTALFAVISTAFSSLATAETVVWSDAFDDGGASSRWSASAGTWQIGLPANGPGAAQSGLRCAGTNLGGDYPANANTRLERIASFVVPAASQNPRLRFWHWYSIGGGDHATVEIKATGASSWTSLSPDYGDVEDYNLTPAGGGVWTRPSLDLSEYAGQLVQIAFHFTADEGSAVALTPGWFVDDVTLVTGTPMFNSPEGFEGGLGDWSTERGSWQVGSPASGPGTAFAGTKCVNLALPGGEYQTYVDSRFISPQLTVPAANQNPRLRFWHWYSIGGGDHATVEIKATGASSWTSLSPDYGDVEDYNLTPAGGGVWTRPSLDLSQYAGQSVQIAFHFTSDEGSAVAPNPGWFVDDLAVVTGSPVLNNLEGFEGGLGDWSTERGTWQVGSPASGPGTSFAGTKCANLALPGGEYQTYVDSRFISPQLTVPAANQNPRLRFWHWYSIGGGDHATVEIKATGASSWTSLSPDYGDVEDYDLNPAGGGVWTRPSLDLSQYAGQSVQIAFHFTSDGGSAIAPNPGWFVDDVAVVTGTVVFNNPEGFEGGLGDWSTERGTWQVGSPVSGPGTAFAGTKGANLALPGGEYQTYVDSRFISPQLSVPAANQNPRFRFWHWYSIGGGDHATVEIKAMGANSWNILSIDYGDVEDLDLVHSGGGVWTRPSLDLSQYAGQSVQIAFHFTSDGGSAIAPNPGWFVDSIEITSDTLVAIPSLYGHPEGTPMNFTAQAAGSNLIFSLAPGAPPGATINPTTGAFSWTPSEQQGPGIYDITVLVNQSGNNLTPFAQSTFTVDVVETNTPPVLAIIGNQAVNAGSLLAFTATAADQDNTNIANPAVMSAARFDDLTFGAWTTYSAASNKNWLTEDYNKRYAYIFGIGANVASDDWLISPPLNLNDSTAEFLRFFSQREYPGPDLTVLVSTNYPGTGNPTASTWTALAPILPIADSSEEWTDSAILDLSAFSGTAVRVAFRYTSTGTTTGTARLWRVDDIEIRGTLAVPPLQTLTYSLGAGAPAGASINPVTGQFTWTPAVGLTPGVYPVTIIVTDNGSLPPNQSDSETIQITVQAIGNAAPVLASIPAQTVNEGTMLNFTATATDTDLPPQPLTFSLTGAPSGASIHATTGVFSWTPSEAQGGLPAPVQFTVQVSDGVLTDDQLVSVTVNEINQAPVLAIIPSKQANSGATISFTATAGDSDLPANALAFSLGAGAPAGATIDPATGAFRWTTPLVRSDLSTPIKIIVTDNGSPAFHDDQDVNFLIVGGDDLSFWQRDKFGDDVDNPAKQATVWGDYADPDKDGTGNLLEFMMVRNPMVSDENLGPKFRLENGKAILRYRETKLADHGIYLFGNWSPDLSMWLSAGLEYATVSDQGDHNLKEIRMPVNRQKRLFQRLEVFRAY